MLFKRKRVSNSYFMPEDVNPVCSSCSREIDGLMSRELTTSLGMAFVWCCPYCHVVLGVSHRRGYAIG